MTTKTILITGATSGIGKAAALKIAQEGHNVVLISRDPNRLKDTQEEIRTKTANNSIFLAVCDLSSQKSIHNTASNLMQMYPAIDVLVNNAGIELSHKEYSIDGIEKTFAVNHLGYFLLTGLLLPNIKRSNDGRVVNVSSSGHKKARLDIDDLVDPKKYSKYDAYRKSKLANVMFTLELANRLKETSISVNTLHPGWVYTNIGIEKADFTRRILNVYKKRFAKTPEEGAETIVYLALSDEVRNISGEYFVKNNTAPPATEAKDTEKRRRLWELSEQLTGLRY